MTPTERQRIEKEARVSMMNPPRPYTDNNFITGYLAGALAEHDKARNQAIQDCIEKLSSTTEVTKLLESLKTII